ncbi:MAG: PDZ domain-containing protein [Proteobacteria bacterium]|nr:PDZ domain-containing protein [Pseudomonadota bacterium]
MRRRVLSLLAVLAATATATAAPRASDPPFLGIVLSNVPSVLGTGCQVIDVTANSGAAIAGLRPNEIILAIETTPITSCTHLVEVVGTHVIGEAIKLELASGGTRRTIVAQLGSRVDMIRRDLLGKPLDAELFSTADAIATTRFEALPTLDLAATRRATIVGWFHPSCADCRSVFDKVARWQRTSKGLAYAVTSASGVDLGNIGTVRDNLRLDVPLALGAMPIAGAGGPSLLFDQERIVFMVIDCHGNVSYVAPVAPGSEDVDAMLDDLFVAADHAQLRR